MICTSRRLRALLASALLLAPALCFGLGADDFVLFGVDDRGHEITIDRRGGSYLAGGDGIEGMTTTMTLRSRGRAADRGTRCELRFKPPTLRCDSAGGEMAGSKWQGAVVSDAARPGRLDPEVRKLKGRFLKRFGYGQVDAAFRCRSGCGPGVPRLIILVWRGD